MKIKKYIVFATVGTVMMIETHSTDPVNARKKVYEQLKRKFPTKDIEIGAIEHRRNDNIARELRANGIDAG